MRVGWLVILAFVAVGIGSVVGLSTTDKRNPQFDVFMAGMCVGWVGIGVSAAVMLIRGVPRDGVLGWAERFVLRWLASLGLFPLLYVGMIVVIGLKKK